MTELEEDPLSESDGVEMDLGREFRVVIGEDIDRERRDLLRMRGGVPGCVGDGSCRVGLVCLCISNWRDVGGR